MDDDAVEEPDDDGDEMVDELADATNTRSSEGLDFPLELDASSAIEKINYNKASLHPLSSLPSKVSRNEMKMEIRVTKALLSISAKTK